MTDRVFVEYGLDFNNNRFGFGRSVEVERTDGAEYRTKGKVAFVRENFYLRIWIFKRVFVISSRGGVSVKHKPRNNLKFVFGISGTKI
jgi:hypothetical protein